MSIKLVTRRTVANVIGESLAASTSISSRAAQADALCWTLMISNCAESKDLPFTTLFIIKLKGIVLSPSQVQPLESNMDDLKTGVFQN